MNGLIQTWVNTICKAISFDTVNIKSHWDCNKISASFHLQCSHTLQT